MKILWAIDAFESSETVSLGAVEAVHGLSESLQAEIQPVYILNRAEVNFTAESGHEVVLALEHFKPAAQSALDNFVSHLDFSDRLLPARILVQTASSLKRSVEMLLSYARKEEVALIAVTTHARSGAARILLGSFTEFLMRHSRIPLLVIGPRGIQNVRPEGTRFKNLVVPIDFGKFSAMTVLSSMGIAKRLSIPLSFFHVDQVDPLPPIFSDGLVPIHDMSRIFSERVEFHHGQFQEWVDFARQKGVEANYAISENLGGHVADEILSFVQSKAVPLTLLCSERGSLVSLIFGSVTRQVMKHSSMPCLVIHSRLIPAACELTSTEQLKKAA